MTEEKKHARLKFPKWDIETIVAEALGESVYSAMPELEYVKLEAQIALGIKALDQQPKQLDPESFQAASIAANLMFNGGSNSFRRLGKELDAEPAGPERDNAKLCYGESYKLMAFAEQSFEYLKGIEVSFGPQVGQRR